jgi:hypothetical protein
MSVNIPTIRVGKPLRYEALSVFPLFTEADSGVEYVLGDVAVQVKEIDDFITIEIKLFQYVADLKQFLVIPGVVRENTNVEGCDGNNVSECIRIAEE